MAAPTSLRFEDEVTNRLNSYVARHPGLSRSALAARLVDEGLRMDEHPGIVFRDGPMGRRATLIGGPDVWEVARTLQAASEAEPELGLNEIAVLVEENTGLSHWLLETAVRYWQAYRDEVDALIAYSDRIETETADRSEWLSHALAR